MTLYEMEMKVLRMIEEVGTDTTTTITDDPDILLKIKDVINQVMFDLAKLKKIPAVEEYEIDEENTELELTDLDNFYQLEAIEYKDSDGEYLEYNIRNKYVTFPEIGTAKIYYYKYPERIDDDTNEKTYTFELSDDALEIMPYGVAGDILKSDVSNQYGNVYTNKYETLLQRLDPRYNVGSIYIDSSSISEVL